MEGKHLVFYDGECGLCDAVVQFILKRDKEQIFVYAPLQGETAGQLLIPKPQEDTVILIENFETLPQRYIYSQAVFRILWLLGGWWALPGLLFFLPPVLFNWGYRLVAKYRKRLFPKTECVLPPPTDGKRFLP